MTEMRQLPLPPGVATVTGAERTVGVVPAPPAVVGTVELVDAVDVVDVVDVAGPPPGATGWRVPDGLDVRTGATAGAGLTGATAGWRCDAPVELPPPPPVRTGTTAGSWKAGAEGPSFGNATASIFATGAARFTGSTPSRS